jgi:HEAT repeat protein
MADQQQDLYDDDSVVPERPDIKITLELLQNSEKTSLNALVFYGLSDLTSDEIDLLQPVWDALSVDHRRKVIQRIVDVNESNLEMDYHQIGLFALNDDDPEVRQAAIEILWEDDSPVFMEKLLEMAQWDESVQVRAAAAGALGQFILRGELNELPVADMNRVQDIVIQLLLDENEDVEVRRRALEAIANCSHEIVTEAIEEAYQSADDRMQASAIFAMGRTCDSQWEEAVLREMSSPDPQMRYEAARASGELEIAEAVPLLRRMAHGDEREIKEVAIWSLGEIGGDLAMRTLTQLADEVERAGDDDLLEAIEDAIGNASMVGSELDFDLDDE